MIRLTGLELRRKQELKRWIITLCRSLDNVLGGGIATGLITEFCGAPGTGKTQLCLQLSINVQLPKEVGGVGGKALYIDTNQGFNPMRLKEIACSMEERFSKTRQKAGSSFGNDCNISVSSLLENVSYVYCPTYGDLMATMLNLRQELTDDPKLKLIIVDSFSFALRQIEKSLDRNRISSEILANLHHLLMEFDVAVVLTNELTTTRKGDEWEICPALGSSYYQKINQRIIVSKDGETRNHVALVEKAAMSPRVAVPFQIKENGIRGVS